MVKVKCWSREETGCDFFKVKDEGGNIKKGEEAVKVWKEHFAKVLDVTKDNTGGDKDLIDGDAVSIASDYRVTYSERLCQHILREEVAWALEKVRKDAAPGKDEVTMNMMSAKGLFDVWVTLFKVRREDSIVPSLWRKSLIVPVPKEAGGV